MVASAFERYTAVNLLTAAYETGRGPADERISVIPLDFSDGSFRDSLTGQRVEDVFSPNDPVSEVNLRMLYHLKTLSDEAIGVWLSGQNWENPKTGKVLVATKPRPGVVVEYDITGDWFSAEQFRDFSLLLSEYDRGGYYLIGESAWSVLPQVIPMPEVWKKILDGQAKVKFNQDVDRLLPVIQQNQGEKLFDSVDLLMGSNVRIACTTPSKGAETFLVRVRITPQGEELHYVKNCGKCGCPIENWIPKDYQCTHRMMNGEICNGIYKGC